jgi:adenylate cyclase class 2
MQADRQSENLEIEVKLKAPARLALIRARLREVGFAVVKKRVFETNVIFDTAESDLRKSAQLIRVRRVGKHGTLTYKGRPVPGKHKSREEIESEISDPGNLELIFERLGYRPAFRYEKFRTEYGKRGERGVITLDETPIGNFLEIEGRPQWIDRTAKKLGFSESDFITKSYGSLYREYREEHTLAEENMVFKKSAAASRRTRAAAGRSPARRA